MSYPWKHQRSFNSVLFPMLREELSPIFLSPESPAVSGRMSSGSLIIDNADAQVLYSPGWKANGSPNEYKHTTSNTETQGAFFTFSFVGKSPPMYACVGWS